MTPTMQITDVRVGVSLLGTIIQLVRILACGKKCCSIFMNLNDTLDESFPSCSLSYS
jgi:hypothetical protein